jgi:dolichyl-phosphate-mannose--protein O-mannosyl transferase
VRHWGEEARRMLADPRAPRIALALIFALSLTARAFELGKPCANPCKRGSDHSLIFDEAYYVNAARVIAGIRPPSGETYSDAPLGKDPNAEHPQLAKLVIAGGIDLLGDGPWGWRAGSIVFGLIAIVAMYALVRAAGGGPWLAVGAAGVMALDNLMLVHGRIATLDIFAVALMLISAALYLRERALLAGLVLGVAGCMKLVALLLVGVLVLLEAVRVIWDRRDGRAIGRSVRARGMPLAIAGATGAATLVLGVWLLDALVPAYDPGTQATYAGDPFAHIGHMLSYAAKLKAVPNATGISSTPWQWLLNQKVIDYSRVAVNQLSGGHIVASKALFAAKGEMNPFVIFLAIPALFAAAAATWRERDLPAAVGLSWCIGTFVPFAIESQIFDRISYLYYMLIVLPGVYLVTTLLFAPSRIARAATIGWVAALIYSFIDLYPVRSF